MISLGLGTLMLLLCLFAMGAFALCEPVRRDDEIVDPDAPADAERHRRKLFELSEIVRDGSHR